MNYLEKIKQLNLMLPSAPLTAGIYRPVVMGGKTAYLSGQLAKTADGKLIMGRVGKDLTMEQGREAAKVAALNVLSVIHHLVGFEKFERIVRLTGYVQCAADFYDIPSVLNAASDLFIQVFGDCGAHARSAVGVSHLPLNSAVELEVTIQII